VEAPFGRNFGREGRVKREKEKVESKKEKGES